MDTVARTRTPIDGGRARRCLRPWCTYKHGESHCLGKTRGTWALLHIKNQSSVPKAPWHMLNQNRGCKGWEMEPKMPVWSRGGLSALPACGWHSAWSVRLSFRRDHWYAIEERCTGTYCRGKMGHWSSNSRPGPHVWLMWIFTSIPLTVQIGPFGSLFQSYNFLSNW